MTQSAVGVAGAKDGRFPNKKNGNNKKGDSLNRTFETICLELKNKDYKLTPQRRTILRVFLENTGGHLSAEELYAIVKMENPEIGLATVYRTLDLFAELGILTKMDFGDNKARFELYDSEVHHHHHLICLSCGKVEEFDVDLLEALEDSIEEKTCFEIVDHRLKFFGYCSKCKV